VREAVTLRAVLFLLGVALVVAGVAMLSVPAALIVAGVGSMGASVDLAREGDS